ncbi:MAG: carboxypeptidase M32, partial [Solobacterium sp.]|nr:carboxypeptidase M32 [Solobacterium sp.]
MTYEEKLQQYKDWIFRRSAYQMALAIIGIDKQTVAPSAGAAYRDERSAYLAGELFSIETDPAMIQLLKELKDDPKIDGDNKRAVELYYKQAMDTM